MGGKLTQHRSVRLTEYGVAFRYISTSRAPKRYVHQDDYYLLGFIEHGECDLQVDFTQYHLQEGQLFVISPGQVHCFVSSKSIDGFLLSVDSCLIDQQTKIAFDKFSLLGHICSVAALEREELRQVAQLISNRISNTSKNPGKRVVHHLAQAFVAIITDAIEGCGVSPLSGRELHIMLAFRSLLEKEWCNHKQSSYYASALHLSTGYLNENVHAVTGMSTNKYILNEVLIHAKRLLIYSTLSIKEIAQKVGYTDYAYFSRLFSQSVGCSPVAFRKKILE